MLGVAFYPARACVYAYMDYAVHRPMLGPIAANRPGISWIVPEIDSVSRSPGKWKKAESMLCPVVLFLIPQLSRARRSRMFHLLMMMVNDMQPFQITIINKTQLDCNFYCGFSVSWFSHN